MHLFFLIFSSALLNTAAQVFLKCGLNRSQMEAFYWKDILILGLNFIKNPFIFCGIVCYVLSLGFWMGALARVPVSYAVPLLSISYVFTALAGVYFFNENLSFFRLLGILMILGGVFCVSRTAG